ncbi:hypothetical protein PPERSA_01595 [Pseudocohnilembus persalinus]|uniref:Transmembrane protein n=1 Tax=Pseudocohnilembus persalinus TaxID=266149 RepID=A0A0V0QHI7_PSEPJ|nr:hypothetical protein PPERSA_01595 [Pseudocohnilembus persalinus]|eukprot:KRX01725.1 hypothetical protein PPERSA_01595 [Pseudocohnilembus persalinus]
MDQLETQETKDKQQKQIANTFKILNNFIEQQFKIQHPYLTKKHDLCKHPNGCLAHLFDISISGVAVGYLSKTAVQLIINLIKNMKQLKQAPIKELFKILINKDSLKFGLVPGTQLFLMQFMQCALRYIRNKEGNSNAFFSGFISGLCILLIKKDFRQIFALYLFVRALDWSFQAYNMCFETVNNPDNFNKFANKNMYEDIADTSIRAAWIQKKNKQLFLKGIKPFDAQNRMYIKHGGSPQIRIKQFY